MPGRLHGGQITVGIDRTTLWPISRIVSFSVAVAFALGLFLAYRRISGALTESLPAAQLFFAAMMSLACAIVACALVRRRAVVWIAGISLLLFAFACSFPGQSAMDWLVWLGVVGAFLASSKEFSIVPRPHITRFTKLDQELQRFTRYRMADGHQLLSGTLLAEFAPGERTATLHIAFCPPFERLPHVEVESTAEAKVVQNFHHGVQVEVRLPRPAGVPTTAMVELCATDAD
jgi:hypothetical protein